MSEVVYCFYSLQQTLHEVLTQIVSEVPAKHCKTCPTLCCCIDGYTVCIVLACVCRCSQMCTTVLNNNDKLAILLELMGFVYFNHI